MALDSILVKYEADVSDLKKELNEVKKETVGFEKQATDSSKKVEQSLNSVGTNVSGKLTSAFKTLGATIAAAFTINAIGQFISSSVELATRAQEIKAEFDKLNNPLLLANLKKSTEGTLSDLKLMEIALRADKLGVPLDKLGKIMEFAKVRADALGKSTEELTDTLVQGIGIKGTRALVQVGISQEEFTAEVKKTGDYFTALDNIMTKTLDGAGEGFDSVADKQDRLRASIENTKVDIGNKLLPVINDLLVGINNAILGFERLFNVTSSAEAEAFDTIVNMFSDGSAPAEGFAAEIADVTESIRKLKEENKGADSALAKVFNAQGVRQYHETLGLLTGQLKALQALEAQQNRKAQAADLDLLTTATEENTDSVEKQAKTFGDLDKQTTQTVKTLGVANETFIDLNLLLTEVQQAMASGDQERYNAAIGKMADIMIAVTTEDLPKLKELFTEFNTEVSDGTDVAREWYESWAEYGGGLVELFDSISYLFKQQEDYKLQVLQERLDKGTISEGQYDKDVKEIQIAQAKRAKLLSVFDVLAKTPPAIMQGFAQLGPVGAILAAALGVTELAAALATPIPAFKTGVVDFKGKGTGTSDDNLVRISNRESIITAKGTAKHKAALEAINKDRFDEYIANIYLKNAMKEKTNDDNYREYLELKRLGYINQNGFKSLEKVISEINRPHRF